MPRKRRKKKKQEIPTTGVIVYTDGGCAINPGGPGGYGVIVINQDTGEYKKYSQGFKSTTNNRMEVSAVLRALKETKGDITIISDSQYTINCANGIWKKEKNTDLWEKYDQLSDGRDIRYFWVAGHTGDIYNEKCDQMATDAMNGKNLLEDKGYKGVKKGISNAPVKPRGNGNNGAMGVKIDIPQDLDERALFSSVEEYEDTYNVHKSCAQAIITFYFNGKKSFSAYTKLKTGGFDYWSDKNVEDMLVDLPDGTWYFIKQHLKDDKLRNAALRWRCRGLALSDSIRKVLVDAEIAEKYGE